MSYYRHVLTLPESFFDSMRVGEMMSRVNDAAKITAFIHEVAVNLVVDILIVLFSVVAMFYVNWKIGLWIISVIPIYSIIYFINNRFNRHWQRKIALSNAEVDTSLVETFTAGTSIRNLALEHHFVQKVSEDLGTLLNNIYEVSVKQLHLQGTGDLISKIAAVLLLWTGSYYVMNDAMTTGELMSLYTLLIWFTAPLLYLLGANRSFNEAAVSAERLFEILELQPDGNGWRKVNAQDLMIEFKDVWFAYGHDNHILKGINLRVKKGQVLGISGKSGSGKSTLASLLIRDYRPTSGTISVNHVDINEIDRQCISEIMTVVSQSANLFSDTIRENITIGMAYDEERLNVICEKLGITEFAAIQSSGLDRVISEQGNNLSGGQKQRIALARALYRNTPLLILDEATTALDYLSEQKIMQTIEWYKNNGNTVIIIAHGESTLKICDNIVVLENGVIK
jgi:ATP-binding cassette subfamily B protein